MYETYEKSLELNQYYQNFFFSRGILFKTLLSGLKVFNTLWSVMYDRYVVVVRLNVTWLNMSPLKCLRYKNIIVQR